MLAPSATESCPLALPELAENDVAPPAVLLPTWMPPPAGPKIPAPPGKLTLFEKVFTPATVWLFVRSTKLCVPEPVPPLAIATIPVSDRLGAAPPDEARGPDAVTPV